MKAALSPELRHAMLQEMGIVPMSLRRAPGADGEACCRLLVPAAARDEAAQARLVQAIATAVSLAGQACAVAWVTAGQLPASAAHDCCLALGVTDLSGERVWALPAPAELLAEPASKRRVWQAARAAAMRLAAGM